MSSSALYGEYEVFSDPKGIKAVMIDLQMKTLWESCMFCIDFDPLIQKMLIMQLQNNLILKYEAMKLYSWLK